MEITKYSAEFSLLLHKSNKNEIWYMYIPYYRKLTLHEIKVLEINAT